MNRHSHKPILWIGLAVMLAAVVLYLHAPQLRLFSSGLFFTGLHLSGVIVLSSVAYAVGGHKLAARFFSRRQKPLCDFGWSSGWTLGPIIAAKVLFAAAILLPLALPRFWPVSIAFTLLAACFFAGGLFARTVSRVENAFLPMVDLLPADGPDSIVLDAGCGSGRTTIALGRALKQGSIIALDRFDAGYIDGGGKTLLEQNLSLAGLQSRVRITPGDITSLPFPDAAFDAAVSAHAMDHLGPSADQGLREILRVLKPGGRFLLIVWVPGWTMFAIANVLSFFLASPAKWRHRIAHAGFHLADEGRFNGYWFALLERPAELPQVASHDTGPGGPA